MEETHDVICLDNFYTGDRKNVEHLLSYPNFELVRHDVTFRNFIVQALKDEDITIYGGGNQTRSFCFVDDLIDGLIGFMELEENFPGPINMGNPTEFTILELAENVIRLRKSKSKVVFRVLPQDDPMQRKPNSELVQRKLG